MIDAAVLILRLAVGGVLIPHGVYKLLNRISLDKKWKSDYGLPAGSVGLTGIIQIAGGVGVILGIYTRFAALILLSNMLVATWISIWKNHEPFLSTPAGKGWDVNFELMATLVALILLGDVGWSLIRF